MDNLTTMLIFLAMVFLMFLYLERESNRRSKAERERFREFVMAAKSQDVAEYVNVLPSEGNLPEEEDEELVDLDQVDPTTLLKAIKKSE